MNDVINQIMPYVISIVSIILGAVSLWIGNKVNAFMEKNKIYDALKANQLIVKASVEYAEQVFQALDGQEKFNIAKQKALEIFNERGIVIGENELDALIEQSVIQFKEGMKRDKKKENKVEPLSTIDYTIKFDESQYVNGENSEVTNFEQRPFV